jgi:hypothetical protein
MVRAIAWHSFRYTILGVGLGILLLGCWTECAIPSFVPCSGPFVCTYVSGPNFALAALFLVVGGLLTMGCGLVFGFQALLRGLIETPTRGSVIRP